MWFGRAQLGVAVARAFARHRIRRISFIGVPRAVLEDRMARGEVGVARLPAQRADTTDVAGFYGHQVLMRSAADAAM